MENFTAPTILITGATGNIGTELSKLLSAQGVPYRAMVRSEDGARALTKLNGAQAVFGDFDDAGSIADALRGVERAFLLTDSSERAEARQCAFVEAASRAGVERIVKLSQWAADADSPVRFLRYHAAVEQKIKDSGVAHTFLRPNLFMQGLLGFRELIAKQNRFFAPIADAEISMVDVRDIAAVAAAALTETRHEGQTYDITGAESLSHGRMAEKLSAALDRAVQFVEVPPAAMREMLGGVGMPEWQAEGLIEDYAHYARGEAAAVASGVRDATGKSPRSFDEFAREYAPAFS